LATWLSGSIGSDGFWRVTWWISRESDWRNGENARNHGDFMEILTILSENNGNTIVLFLGFSQIMST
jgi:hypothetical protein